MTVPAAVLVLPLLATPAAVRSYDTTKHTGGNSQPGYFITEHTNGVVS